MIKLTRLAIAGVIACTATFHVTPSAFAQSGDYFAIGGCFKSYDAASNRAEEIGADVIDTNEYPNFRNGWYCAAVGPYDRTTARNARDQFKADGVSDAYVKSGW